MHIPIYEGKQIIGHTVFTANLNVNGEINGLKRLFTGEHIGKLVFMYYNEAYPEMSFGDVISEEEAYNLAFNNCRMGVIEELNLVPDDLL